MRGGKRKGAGRKRVSPDGDVVTKAITLTQDDVLAVDALVHGGRFPTLSAAIRFILRDWLRLHR